MAERRMFAKTIIDSDAFLDMPLSTQALYFHLNMRADDDGFINNPKRIQRTIGASEDDLKLLILKRFVIGFESGVVVIKHWRMHNTLRKDRYTPTLYQEELATLAIKENSAYTENHGNHSATNWQPDGNPGEDRVGKDNNSIYLSAPAGEENDEFSTALSTKEESKLRVQEGNLFQGKVIMSDEQLDDLLDKLSLDELHHYIGVIIRRIDIGKPFRRKTHYQAILDMAAQDRKLR